MQLSNEQRDLLLKRLTQNSYWDNPPCFICKSQQWNVSDIVFELREFQAGDLVVGGPVFPIIALTCAKCGNTLFLNAVVLGVLDGVPSLLEQVVK